MALITFWLVDFVLEFQNSNPTVRLVERLLRLMNTLFTNCTILIAYLVIYFVILKTYKQLGIL
jgi:hypothetical protein